MPRRKIVSDMGWRSDWTAIRSASPGSGLARLTRDFEQDKSDASTALSLVAAHMWLRDYEAAARICGESEAARHKSMSASVFSVQRGTALWCLGRFEDARIAWWQAAKAHYADAAGANVHYLLLLFADSVLTGADVTRIRDELDRKTTDRRAHSNWPGPIGMFQLGIYGASYLVDLADRPLGRWQFDFHDVVKRFGLRQQREVLINELDLLLARVEDEPDLEAFVDYARLPELHIAPKSGGCRCGNHQTLPATADRR